MFYCVILKNIKIVIELIFKWQNWLAAIGSNIMDRKHIVPIKAGNESRENESRSKMFSSGCRIRLLKIRK